MSDTSDKTYTGVVVWFDSRSGLGFIAPDDTTVNEGKDLFVHYTNIKAEGFKNLRADQKVKFKIGANHKGPQAVEIEVIAK